MSKYLFNIEYRLLRNNKEENKHIAEIRISNSSAQTFDDWTLCFNQYMYSLDILEESKNDAVVDKVIGDYYEIKGKTSIPANGSLNLTVRGGSIITNLTDTPSCYYFVVNGKELYPAGGISDLSILNKQATRKKNKINYPEDVRDELRLIPTPSQITYKEGYCDFNKFNYITNLTNLSESELTVKTVIENYREIILNDFKFCSGKSIKSHEVSLKFNESLERDAFTIYIEKESILIQAGSQGGFLYALISLFKLADSYNNIIPCMIIDDKPRFSYRGMLFDVSRNFRTVDEVKKFMKMMALYKLNIFHCRLTDDEGWSVEIKKYPNIAQLGGFRGFGQVIPSHHGSGIEKKGGYYSQQEVRELIDYANSLNITFIPEIVIPGHSRALIMSFTEYNNEKNPLVDNGDNSIYKSAQNFSDNTLNPGLNSTFNILQDIYGELADIFKVQQEREMSFSDYFHIGVDETPNGAWMKSPACKKLIDEYGFSSTREIQFYFVNKVIAILKENGYKTAGWQEIIYGGSLKNSDTLVYLWNAKLDGFDLDEADTPLILAPSPYFYFDLTYSEEPNEPGLHWAGCNNPEIIYSFDPMPDNSPNKDKIKGVQACLWSENLGLPKLSNNDKLPKRFLESAWEYMAFPKMTAFSEVAWSEQENRNWLNYSYRYSFEIQILDKMNIKYRIENI